MFTTYLALMHKWLAKYCLVMLSHPSQLSHPTDFTTGCRQPKQHVTETGEKVHGRTFSLIQEFNVIFISRRKSHSLIYQPSA